MDGRVDKILSFLKEIEKYKTIERTIYCSSLTRKESDAEHSWHLAMFLILFEKDLPESLDMKKMLKLSMMHDLVEIYAGDTFAYDKQGQKTKKGRELAAAKKLFSKLPEDLGEEFFALFEEYENVLTPEAKMVKSFDKIQPILQNICAQGKDWDENGITYSDIDEYKRKHMQHSDFVMKIYEKLMDEAKSKDLI